MKDKTTIAIMQYLIAFIMFAVSVVVVNNSIKKSEQAECIKWQEWDERYPHFTANKSMKEQCNNYNIEL